MLRQRQHFSRNIYGTITRSTLFSIRRENLQVEQSVRTLSLMKVFT